MIKPIQGVLLLVMLIGAGRGQTTGRRGSPKPVDIDPDEWSFAAVAYGYIAPNDISYFSPLFTADRKWLHLEARYNYEDQQTGSLWAGYNFSFGRKLIFQATPMVGAIFGNTSGAAPGYEASLTYKRLSLSSEGEYAFDFKSHAKDFFYSWSELVYSPTSWFHAGLAEQRTLVYRTPLDTQRGLSAGFTYRKVDLTGYAFNIGGSDPTGVVGLGFRF